MIRIDLNEFYSFLSLTVPPSHDGLHSFGCRLLDRRICSSCRHDVPAPLHPLRRPAQLSDAYSGISFFPPQSPKALHGMQRPQRLLPVDRYQRPERSARTHQCLSQRSLQKIKAKAISSAVNLMAEPLPRVWFRFFFVPHAEKRLLPIYCLLTAKHAVNCRLSKCEISARYPLKSYPERPLKKRFMAFANRQ